MSADDQNQNQPPRVTIRARRRPTQPEPEVSSAPAPVETDAPSTTPEPDEKRYRVGYKCPPKHTQFQSGNSGGNRKGRPKGSRNWTTIMDEAASRKRTIGVGDKKMRMCGREAVAEQLVIKAIKGDKAALLAFLNEMRREAQQAPGAGAPEESAEPLSASDEALLADFFERAAKARKGEEEQ